MSDEKNNSTKKLNTLMISLGVLGLVCVLYVVITSIMKARDRAQFGNFDCVTATTKYSVDDEYMASVLHKGETVSALDNFYACNEVKRNDLVLFRFSDQIAPVVRIVRGLPGDKYTVEKSTEAKTKWTLAINGQKVLGPSGKPFLIESNSVPPLRTYELSRNGLLLADEYIVLSTEPPGLSDSTNLGLIHKQALVGRVRQK